MIQIQRQNKGILGYTRTQESMASAIFKGSVKGSCGQVTNTIEEGL